jgi:prevent-host-death family protein
MPSIVTPLRRSTHIVMCTPAYTQLVERIGARELRANAATAIRRAAGGERIVITVDGRPVAQLGPLDPVTTPPTLEDLAARGLVRLPNRPDRPEPATVIRPWAGVRLDRHLSEIR